MKKPASIRVPTVGLISDSHVTTAGGLPVWYVRSKFAEGLVSTAIRPPASEVLATNLLRYFLEQLTNANPDFILFLGDASNSGCRDELEAAFAVLRDFRCKAHKPVFYVLGNHDILANGNEPKNRVRERICGCNDGPMTKFEVMKLVSDFNRESAQLPGISQYTDNFNSITPPASEAQARNCRRPGYFLAGYFQFTNGNPNAACEVLLTDTCDYSDVESQTIAGMTFYGARGSISWKSDAAQTAYFQQFTNGPALRIIASHYPTDEFKPWPLPWNKVAQAGKLCPVGKTTLWVSGHTHTPEPCWKHLTFTDRHASYGCLAINVGSTIDKAPQATVLRSARDTLQLAQVKVQLGGWTNGVFSRLQSPPRTYRPVACGETPLAPFGLDRSYRNGKWLACDTRTAVNNLRRFIEDELVADKTLDRLTLEAYLGLLAAKYEAK
jgi:predicted phosphodiesterase